MPVEEKESVKKIKIYSPAKTMESVAREYGIDEEKIIKLAANENRLGCSPKVAEALLDKASEMSFYPDVNATKLRKALADKLNVGDSNLIFGNGSFELISLIANAYIDKGDEAIYAEPSFGWYVNVTNLNEGIPVAVPVDENKSVCLKSITGAITERTRVIWICNPNNPTGTIIPPEQLTGFIEETPKNILIVLDEAYIDFADSDYINTVDFIKSYDNVILLRTFSKLYGLASFRIGYGIADEKIIQALTKVKMPINVNFAAIEAAYVSLQDTEYVELVKNNNRESLDYYYQEFDRLSMDYIKSNCNFILVHTGIDGEYLENEFLKRGIVIRNGGEFGLKDWLRISIGTPYENRQVIKALKDILEKLDKGDVVQYDA